MVCVLNFRIQRNNAIINCAILRTKYFRISLNKYKDKSGIIFMKGVFVYWVVLYNREGRIPVSVKIRFKATSKYPVPPDAGEFEN